MSALADLRDLPAPAPRDLLTERIEFRRADDAARDVLRRERAEAEQNLPPVRDSYLLSAQYDEVKPPKGWRIAGLQRPGHTGLLYAPTKAGKTTVQVDIARALATGTEVMGAFPVTAPTGRVGVWNIEMDAEDYEQYCREGGITAELQ